MFYDQVRPNFSKKISGDFILMHKKIRVTFISDDYKCYLNMVTGRFLNGTKEVPVNKPRSTCRARSYLFSALAKFC